MEIEFPQLSTSNSFIPCDSEEILHWLTDLRATSQEIHLNQCGD